MNDWRMDGEAAHAHALLEEELHEIRGRSCDATSPLPMNKDTNMRLNEAIESKFLKQEDVDGEVLVTVEGAKKQNVAKPDDPPEYKLTVKFREFPKPFVANATNTKRMFKALGEDSDDWVGKQIMLFVDPDVEYGGKITGGLRVRATRRTGTVASAAKGRSEDDVNSDLRAAADDEVPF